MTRRLVRWEELKTEGLLVGAPCENTSTRGAPKNEEETKRGGRRPTRPPSHSLRRETRSAFCSPLSLSIGGGSVDTYVRVL